VASRIVSPPADGWSLTIPQRMWQDLSAHLFRTDTDEHGGVILAGLAPGPRGPRLLARELLLATDGIDYIPGTTGHRALRPEFVRDAALRAGDEHLAYLAFHNHFGTTTVSFSITDMASHERGYPALQQLTGQVIGGLVFTPCATAGDLWLPDGQRVELAEAVIPGTNMSRLRPRPAPGGTADPLRQRQALLLGDQGQEVLRRMRVAVAGLGGAGSILVEFLARLGIGQLVLIDDDTVDEDGTNLCRLVAADPEDFGRPKTELAARNARRANPNIELTIIDQRIEAPEAREALSTCDWIFLAADTHAARHWVNQTIHQFLIPGTQVGVKIPVNEHGNIGQIHTVTRVFLPGEGCMWCNGLINPTQLAIDMLPKEQRDAGRYIPDVPSPSVITLNGIAATEALNHLLLTVTSLHADNASSSSVIHLVRSRERCLQDHRQEVNCRWCTTAGILAAGADRPPSFARSEYESYDNVVDHTESERE
jgi:molybdopterin/thiamine biosynthesis adenylyltransferase